jgi:membrane dipeptidase
MSAAPADIWPIAIPADQDFADTHGVSLEAVQLLRASEVIDLHIDTFIPPRLPLFYNLFKRHERGFLGGRFFGHLDFPRIVEGGLTGALWSITTNPFRRRSRRWVVFQKNLKRFRAVIDATEDHFRIVTSHSAYLAARASGAHAVMLSIQGGNALEAAPDGLRSVRDSPIVRVTLVHLTNAGYGITSSPFKLWKGKRGLSDSGRAFVEMLNAERVFVDLAHINPQGFWDAVEVHDKSQPLLATHTGVDGVKKHWRNLDDAQIRAVADTGGSIGVIFSQAFLKVRGGPKDGAMIVDHMQHVIDLVGDDHVSIGSDYDGAIVPPPDLRSGVAYVRLVQHMLDRGWDDTRIIKVLGGNYLRAFAGLRP